MNSLSKSGEVLLQEILEHRDDRGVCDSNYWGQRFEQLTPEDDATMRSTFKELIEADMISVMWADDYPYYLEVLANGVSHLEKRQDSFHHQRKSGFDLLKRKDIIQILDGDELLGSQTDKLLRMPYLSGQDLCMLSDQFGLHQEYGASRWTYLDNLLGYLIERERCDELLCHLFDLERFHHLESLSDPTEVMNKHQEICDATIDRINSKLALGRHELQYVGGHFYISETGSKVVIETPYIKRIDVPYVLDLSERCKEDFLQGNFDSVISKSRTLIEEVLVHILESKDESVTAKGNIEKLYNQVKNCLNMQQDKSYDGRVNSLLYGLERIVESIGAMRNLNSDAHGVGKNRIKVKEREAKLAMNSAITFCEYILSIEDKTNG